MADRSRMDDALEAEARAEREAALLGPESPEGRALGAIVGENVARARSERRLTREELALRSRIRTEILAALENGDAVPSLRAIWELATALGVPFGSLLARTSLAASSDPDFRHQSSGRGRTIRNADGSFRSRVLFLEGDPRSPEVYELTLEPGCVEPASAHAAGTYEHITVSRGELVVASAGREATLRAGDSIFFRADVAHEYRNPGTVPSVAHLVMSYGTPRE